MIPNFLNLLSAGDDFGGLVVVCFICFPDESYILSLAGIDVAFTTIATSFIGILNIALKCIADINIAVVYCAFTYVIINRGWMILANVADYTYNVHM